MFCKNCSFAVTLSKFLSLIRTEEGNELRTCGRIKIIVASQFGFGAQLFFSYFQRFAKSLASFPQTKTASEGTQRA